jgi:hypothetical protein
MNTDYDDLAARAEAGTLAPIPGTVLRGDDARDAGRAALMAATGTDTVEDAARLALGRPRVGEARTPTVVWKVRASAQLDDLVTDFAKNEGTSMSELVRVAVAEYVRSHSPA